MNSSGFLALISSIFISCFANAETSAIPGSEISLSDYFAIEGIYQIKAVNVHPGDTGEIESQNLESIDRLILFFDAKTKSLSGSLSTSNVGAPLVLFEELGHQYSDDKSALVIHGAGATFAAFDLTIDVRSGEVTGRFSDSSSAGFISLEGRRILSLQGFMLPLEDFQTDMAKVTGVYQGQNSHRQNCGLNRDRVCKIKLVLRQFKKDQLTAVLFFEVGNEKYHSVNYVGGVFVPAHGLVEFASRGRADFRLRSKLNVQIVEDAARIFTYGTNGQHAYWFLKKTSEQLN